MDVLSDIFSSIRTGQPGVVRAEWHPPWGQRFPEQHGSAGFIVVLQGPCWLVQEPGPTLVRPGDVIFMPRGDGCALAGTPGAPLADPPDDPLGEGDVYTTASFGEPAGGAPTVMLCGGYALDPTWTHPLLRELPPTIQVTARMGHSRELQAAVHLLDAEIDSNRPGADAIVPIALDMLLLYILRAWFEQQPADPARTGWAAALADTAVRAALNAIHRFPAQPWTVQALAEQARLSRAAFSRRFSTLSGQPPLGYLTWWRLTLAANLLRNSDVPLAAVASRVGYGSQFAFANAFKRQYGMAPGRFRRCRSTLVRSGRPADHRG